MDKLKKDDIIQYITVDPSSEASKYKYQYGFVNSVGPTNYSGKVLYSIKFIDGKIVYGIPEDCIRKATVNEEQMFSIDFARKFAKKYVDANNRCYGNKIEQVFFDDFVTENKEENKNMYNIGDVIKYHIFNKLWLDDRDLIKYNDMCAKIVNYNIVTCNYTIEFADLQRFEVTSYDFIPATTGEICRFNMIHDRNKACKSKWYEIASIDPPILSDFRKTMFESFEKSIMSKFLSDNKEEEIKNMNKIKKVIFSGDRTVVLWNDGDKTIVKASNEAFDKEKGLAMAIAKKALGSNKNKSNYYDVFKKWIPEEEENKEEPKEFPMNKPEDSEEEGKPWDPSMRHQSFKKKTREQISEEIVDKIMAGADTEDIKKSIEESKKIIEHEKVKAAAPKVTSYKPSEPSEMGVISDFVKTFKPTYFFKDFLEFCKNNGLAFITNDGEIMNPFEVSLPKLNWLGKQKRITTVTKHKVYPGTNNQGKDVMAVDVNETLFQRLPREFRTKGQKED